MILRLFLSILLALAPTASFAAGTAPLILPRELAPGVAAANLGFTPLSRSKFIVADSIDLTGATDASTALQALINANPTTRIYVPAGTPLLNNVVTLNSGQTLQCEGRTQTVFQVNSVASGYNLGAANGVIILGTGEPGATVLDCGVSFTQPSPLSRSNVIHYPTALYAKDASRFIIDRVRVSNAWKCLDATGNTGGARIGILECGAYANDAQGAISFDGALDFIHIHSIECWPFGGLLNGGTSLYHDGTNVCYSQGRADGVSINILAHFDSTVSFTTAASGSLSVTHIASLQSDGDNANVTNAGAQIQISNWYSSKGSASLTTNSVATISGGNTYVANLNYFGAGTLGPAISVSNGSLMINGGNILQSEYSHPALEVTGGYLTVQNAQFNMPEPRTAPFINQTAGMVVIRNNRSIARTSSTAPIISVSTDLVHNFVSGNNFPNWAHTLPTTAVGYYDMEEPDTLTLNPYFQTQGDFSASSVVTTGTFRRKGDSVLIDGAVTFNTNAYTTAGATFALAPNTPTPIGGNYYCSTGPTENVTLPTTSIVARVSPGPAVYFKYSTSGGASGLLSTPHVLPSKTGVTFNINCLYRVR